MHVSRVLSFLVWIAVATLLRCSAYGCSTSGSRLQATGDCPRLVTVSVYSAPWPKQRVTVDIAHQRVSLLVRAETSRLVECALTKNEVSRLCNLVKPEELGPFRPELQWFGSGLDYRLPLGSGRTYLVVKWDRQEIALRLPPNEIRSGLPEWAKKVYASIDLVVERLGELSFAHCMVYRSAAEVKADDNRVTEFEAELARYISSSQPQGVTGW